MSDENNPADTAKLAALLGESVDAISAKLADLNNAELAALVDLEKTGPKPRKTLLDAIDTLLAAREADEAGAGAANAAAGGDQPDAAPDAQPDAAPDAAPDDQPDAAPDDLPDVMPIDADGGASATGRVYVVFSGERGLRVKALPPLEFGHRQFSILDENRIALDAKIELSPDMPSMHTVEKAWLVNEDGGVIAWAPIGLMPVTFGRGTRVELTGGSLIFRRSAD